jgi:hypothetical protein
LSPFPKKYFVPLFHSTSLFCELLSGIQQNMILDYHTPEGTASNNKERFFREGPQRLPAGFHFMGRLGSKVGTFVMIDLGGR